MVVKKCSVKRRRSEEEEKENQCLLGVEVEEQKREEREYGRLQGLLPVYRWANTCRHLGQFFLSHFLQSYDIVTNA